MIIKEHEHIWKKIDKQAPFEQCLICCCVRFTDKSWKLKGEPRE